MLYFHMMCIHKFIFMWCLLLLSQLTRLKKYLNFIFFLWLNFFHNKFDEINKNLIKKINVNGSSRELWESEGMKMEKESSLKRRMWIILNGGKLYGKVFFADSPPRWHPYYHSIKLEVEYMLLSHTPSDLIYKQKSTKKVVLKYKQKLLNSILFNGIIPKIPFIWNPTYI
jgi:hypothetical protein